MGAPLIKPFMKSGSFFIIMTSTIHSIPIHWLNIVYDYQTYARMILVFLQQGVFAVTFITRSTAVYNVYLGESTCNSMTANFFVDIANNEITTGPNRFFYVLFLFAFSESFCVDVVAIVEKYKSNHGFSMNKQIVNWIKYLSLISLCNIYFKLTTGGDWMAIFDNTQEHQVFYEWKIRKFTVAYMMLLCSVQYFIVSSTHGHIDDHEHHKSVDSKHEVTETKHESKDAAPKKIYHQITSIPSFADIDEIIAKRHHRRINSIDAIKLRQSLKAD